MRAGMQNEKRQPELIGARQLLRQRANGIGVKLRIGRGEINQVSGMGEDRAELSALRMIKERLDFRASERPREPLHVVFHENLHRAALDRARSLYRARHSARDRHVSAEENCRFSRLWEFARHFRNQKSANSNSLKPF